MIIKWIKTCEVHIVENDQNDYYVETIEEGMEDDVSIINENENCVDMQFEDGSLALGLDKSSFEIIKE